MSVQQQLRGTGVALVTPFFPGGDIDYNALSRIIDHVIEGGIDYIVTLGTTGETPTLSAEEKTDLIRFTFDMVASRVPVVVGIGDYNTRDVVKRLETCPLDQAIAVLSVSPYYSKPSQEGLFQHYAALAKASPKPIILYNVPSRTGRNITAQTTLRLASQVENIIGMKEASGDMTQCMQLVKNKPEGFVLLSGDDALALAQMACGFEGLISVAANYFPSEISSMIRHTRENRFPEARALHYKLWDAFELMFQENNPAGIKAFLSVSGICQNAFRLPVVPLSPALQQGIRNFLSHY